MNGRRVVRSPDWDRSHNYKGVYDMILDKVRACNRVGIGESSLIPEP